MRTVWISAWIGAMILMAVALVLLPTGTESIPTPEIQFGDLPGVIPDRTQKPLDQVEIPNADQRPFWLDQEPKRVRGSDTDYCVLYDKGETFRYTEHYDYEVGLTYILNILEAADLTGTHFRFGRPALSDNPDGSCRYPFRDEKRSWGLYIRVGDEVAFWDKFWSLEDQSFPEEAPDPYLSPLRSGLDLQSISFT
jgi:hypothetical protein